VSSQSRCAHRRLSPPGELACPRASRALARSQHCRRPLQARDFRIRDADRARALRIGQWLRAFGRADLVRFRCTRVLCEADSTKEGNQQGQNDCRSRKAAHVPTWSEAVARTNNYRALPPLHSRSGQEAGDWCCLLLGASRERPCRRRAAEQRDEIAPLPSITSSARASSIGGASRPRAVAVLRLMTSFEPTRSLDGHIACLGPLETTRLGRR
jgi:hypothetical protein